MRSAENFIENEMLEIKFSGIFSLLHPSHDALVSVVSGVRGVRHSPAPFCASVVYAISTRHERATLQAASIEQQHF